MDAAETKAETRLPRPLSSFVDRVDDIDQLLRLIEEFRLVSLVGPGGVGKTRLAIETGWRHAPEHRNGACFVDLAPLNHARDIPAAFVRALPVSLPLTGGRRDAVVRHLRDMQMLIIVDNCEHLVDASATYIEHLLSTCRGLTILATSREPLSVVGEHVWRVKPLLVADSNWIGSIRELEQVPAVRLFLDRAQAVEAAFAVTSSNATAVADVCRKLDGLPLAIELAATRVTTLGAAQISARLDDRLSFLRGSARSVIARHQTLRAALGWSYALLTEVEQHTFDRLSVFAGRWSLAATEAVCAGIDLQNSTPLDVLSQLVAKSLVIAEGDAQGEMTYRLLETVREFGVERLEARGEADAVRQLHAEYFASFVRQASDEWSRERQRASVHLIADVYDNFSPALTWYLIHQPERGLEVAHELTWFWRQRGYFSEGRHWLMALLERTTDNTPQRQSALIDAGQFASLEGDASGAMPLLESAVALARLRADDTSLARALSQLGRVANRLGQTELARTYCSESLLTSRAAGNTLGLTEGLVNAGIVAAEQGDMTAARAAYEECIRYAKSSRDDWTSALAMRSLGHIVRLNGELETARRLFIDARAIWTELGDTWGIAWCLSGLGYIAIDLGALDEAREYFTECLHLRRSLGAAGSIANSLECFASLAAAAGDAERAFRLAGAVRQLRASIGEQPPQAESAAFERTLDSARSRLSAAEVQMAIRTGESYALSDALAYALQTQSAHSATDNHGAQPRLTPREQQVVKLIAGGRTNREIADTLVITVSTAERHVANILTKLGLRSRTELAIWAVAHGLDTTGESVARS